MTHLRLILGSLVAMMILQSCATESGQLVSYDPEELEKEIAEDIEMIYSDSAVIEFRIRSPRLEKYELDKIIVEEFPKGFLIEFFDENMDVISKLSSKYAMRKSAKGELMLRDSVAYTNDQNDILETNALVINESEGTISTKKFFRLIKGDTRDTIYGRGFDANSDFTRFQIKKYLAKRQGIDVND